MTTRSTAKSTSGEPGNVSNQVYGHTVTLENGEEVDNRNASEIRKVLEDDSVSVNDLQLLASSLEMSPELSERKLVIALSEYCSSVTDPHCPWLIFASLMAMGDHSRPEFLVWYQNHARLFLCSRL